MLNKKNISFIFILCLWLTSVTAKPHFFFIKIKSNPENSTAQDIKHAFIQLTNNLNIHQPLPPDTIDQIKTGIEEYEYIYKNEQQWFNIKFNKKSVLAYLEKNHLLANHPKPPVTMLLVVHKNNNALPISDMETQASLLNDLVKAAKSINLNLFVPSMDLIDLDLINIDDLWQQKWLKIKPLTDRYGTEQILLVELEASIDGSIVSSWHFTAPLSSKTLTLKTKNIDEAIHQAIPQLTSATAIEPHIQNLHLQVYFKNDQIAYQETLSLIKKFPGVQNVQLDGVTQGSVFYKLNLNCDTDHLLNVLKGHKNITQIRVLS